MHVVFVSRQSIRRLLTLLPLVCALHAAEDALALMKRAESLEGVKKFSEATQIYDQLIATMPREPAPYARRGWVRHLEGKEAEALADLDKAASLSRNDPFVLFSRGVVRKTLGSFAEAAADFLATARSDPQDHQAFFEAAFCLLRVGRAKDALPPIEAALKLQSQKYEYFQLRGLINERLGNRDQALADCEAASRLTQSEQARATIDKVRQRILTAKATARPGGSLTSQPADTAGPAKPASAPILVSVADSTDTRAAPTSAPPKSRAGSSDAMIAVPAPTKGAANKAASASTAKSKETERTPAAKPPTPKAAPIAQASPPQTPAPATGPTAAQKGSGDFIASVESAVAAMPVGNVMPSVMLPAIDLSAVSSEHWAGIVTQVKEGMAQIYGDMTPAQQKAFEAQWAPYFDFPAPEVLAYFGKLHPLVSEFVLLKEAYGRSCVACDQAQFQLANALASEDFDAAVSFSYSLKRTNGMLAAHAARMNQLTQAVQALGEPPDPLALKKKARKHHENLMQAAAIPAENIEGIWESDDLGTWTLQILNRYPKEIMLVDVGDGGRGLLQPFAEPNSWLFIQGSDTEKPEKCRFWRLDIIKGQLQVRSYKPSASPNWYEVGSFKTYLCKKTKPLTERESYSPASDTDMKGKPLDWAKLFEQRFLAQIAMVEVLRFGALPPEKETSRRRAWAAEHADSELNDTIERMAAEQGIDSDKVVRVDAQGRAFDRLMAEQYYYYGSQPPGFDNCAKYDQLTLMINRAIVVSTAPDLKARARRQNMLLWNLQQQLNLRIKQQLDYVVRLHDMKPDQVSNDQEVLRQAVKEAEQQMGKVQDLYAKGRQKVQNDRDDALSDLGQQQTRTAEDMEFSKIEWIKYTKADLAKLESLPPEKKEKSRPSIALLNERLRAIPLQHNAALRDLDERYAKLFAEERAKAKQLEDDLNKELEKKLGQVQERIKFYAKRGSEIQSQTIQRATDDGKMETVSLSQVLAEAKKKTQEEFDLPGYLTGLIQRMDEELPGTKGRESLDGLSFSGVPGDCQLELPLSLSAIRRVASPQGADLAEKASAPAPAPAPEQSADALSGQQQELEAQAKKEKIAAFTEEIAALQKSLEGIRKTEEEIAPNDKDRTKKLEGLVRDRMVVDANIKAASDQIRFIESGVYQRTRTSWDDFNQHMMSEDSRATANYWENVNRKLDRMDRLIEAAPVDERDALRRKWNTEVEASIKAGCKFDQLDAAAQRIGNRIQTMNLKEGAAAEVVAAREDSKLRVAEGVKTVASYAMTGLTIYATAGLGAPVSLIMPTCAETAISTTYSLTTGYIEGGPVEAFKQASSAFSQIANLVNLSMESYQRGVLNHLDEQARDPQKVKLDETGAGLSAMGWTLAGEGAKLAVLGYAVNPSLVAIKSAMKPPRIAPKSGGGIFGPEEIRFKSVAEMKESRMFRDKDIYGKHLMQQFKKTHEDIQEARTAGKSDAEIQPLLAKAEQAYKTANSDFHAKNWMKRLSKLDEGVAKTWCDLDAVNKAKVIKATQDSLQAQGLSSPELRGYSNSASKGSVGMDMDLGFVEPTRWIEVPHWKDPSKTMKIVNPEYWKWRKSLTITDPATGKTKVISPREYAEHAHKAMNEAYAEVYGHPPDEAFLEFTFRDHPEAYADMAWLGKKKEPGSGVEPPPWADFSNINPAQRGQAADVTAFKVNRMQKPGKAGGTDELPSLPRYSVMLEQSRGLVKDFDTKLLGGKAKTDAFGNESGNVIRVNPASPLAQMPKEVQSHFLEIRNVLNDFASGRITPSQAEQKLHVLTGGQGIVEVPQQMKVVLENFTPKK